VPPGDALNLKPRPYHTGLQVHIRPAETKGFTLTYAESKSDRPSRRRRYAAPRPGVSGGLWLGSPARRTPGHTREGTADQPCSYGTRHQLRMQPS
jgi:hypothetical protein